MSGYKGPVRLLVIGAGSRGNAYAKAVSRSDEALGTIASVAEPIEFKRMQFGMNYIWGPATPSDGQEFDSWQAFIDYEKARRAKEAAGEHVLPGVDGIFVCTLDGTHREIIEAFAPLGVHIMSEKPLATTLDDCLRIYRALEPAKAIFSIGHVLRYSPHNMLLRKLLLEERAIGDVISIEHTEPVGYWHFAHSYVRGNWRKESATAPSLLTKSCHDIDFLLWLLCYPRTEDPRTDHERMHEPSTVASSGSLSYFKRSRKPGAARTATNCFQCPIGDDCIYSAEKIYVDKHLLKQKNTGWPVSIIVPEIEECWQAGGKQAAETLLRETLAQNYDRNTSQAEIEARPWYGRCVWESDNDVCDDQTVTMQWDEETSNPGDRSRNRGAKSATFHMIAFTDKQCERRGRIYGSLGEISYDSKTIEVNDFASGVTTLHHPRQPKGEGHGGGDSGLARQYVLAIDAVKNGGMDVHQAQVMHVKCTLDEAVRSHAMVFAAEEARKEKKVIDWPSWWKLQAGRPQLEDSTSSRKRKVVSHPEEVEIEP